MKSQASYPVIPVNQLKPGMYVIAIASQTGGMEIAQMGMVTSVAQIANLVRQGVLTVRIDLARSKLGSAESDAVISPDLNANSAQAGRRASANGEGRELKIRRLYQEARELQGKFIRQLKAGEPIDITPLAEVAEEMVDTMFSHGDAMLCLARIRAKDAYLMEHSMNVAILLANFGRYLGLERSVLKELTLGGLLHDVGKIMTPDEVLNKPGKLTDEEFAIMRQHVVHSYEILSNTPGITPTMLEVAANHHERLDGTGYPQRLKGDQLSLYTRMSGIVDVYDAITADRVYKAGMQPRSGLQSGHAADPGVSHPAQGDQSALRCRTGDQVHQVHGGLSGGNAGATLEPALGHRDAAQRAATAQAGGQGDLSRHPASLPRGAVAGSGQIGCAGEH